MQVSSVVHFAEVQEYQRRMMVSDHPFRKSLAIEDSIDELVDNAGKQFDREVVSAFMEVLVDEGRIDIEEYAGIKDRLRFGGRHHAMP